MSCVSRVVSSKALPLGLQMATFLCLYKNFPPCVCVLISFSYEDSSQIELEPTLMTSFYLNYLLKDPVSKYSHILRYQGLGLQNMSFRKTQLSP